MATWLSDYLRILGSCVHTVLISGRGMQRLRRLGYLLAWLTVFPGFALVGFVCLGLDRLLFKELRSARLEAPLIIVGNHRTGSTFLQRLLAKDQGTFATATLVDIFLPSLLQKRLLAVFAALDRAVGRPLGRVVGWLDERWGQDYRQVHPMGITLPEEDEFWLILGLKSGAIWETFPLTKGFRRFFWTDSDMPTGEADRAMALYGACALRQHRFHRDRHGEQAVWMTKNPLFTPKTRALRRAFPDARFLVLIRDPRKVVPSTASLLHAAWWATGTLATGELAMERVHEICERFYDELPPALDGLPPERCVYVRFEDLKADNLGTLERSLGQLGVPVTAELRAAIEENQRQGYRPTHSYSLEDWGLSEEGIIERYRGVMEEWGYLEEGA